MCGLAGVARIGGGPLTDDADVLLGRMARAVSHRGPDGERLFRDGPVALAFERLALVGPESGDQPLFSADDSTVLIANGEVYNHRALEAGLPGIRLRTRSDCEVLAHLYAERGLRFLDAVHGMYAIALWDRARNRLVFARDRFGIKPLYYTVVGDEVIFASEIKALFEHPRCTREVDWAGALAHQAMTVDPCLTRDPVTAWFRDIHVVPAGHTVTVDLADGRIEQQEYWRLPSFGDGTSEESDADLVAAYRDLLVAAVRDCVSGDAELGLLLSGGVDSAAVAAIAARSGARIHTFSVFSGSTLHNGDAEFAHRTAVATGLPNHQVLFGADLTPGVAEWRDLLWLLETPLCGAEQFYKYHLHRYAKQVRPELRGMLLGQASDEFNGGYSTVLSTDGTWSGFQAAIGQLARGQVLRERPALAPWWQQHGGLLSDDVLAGGPLEDPYTAYVGWKYRHVQQYNCWHEDRTAAGNGIEARVPFLDHRIIELVAGIPANRHADLLWDKRILREAVRGLLPPEIAQRPKVPFFYGSGAGFTHRMLVRMLAQDNGALVEQALAAPGAKAHLRPDALRALTARLRTEVEPADVEFLLRLVNLGLLDQMVRDLPVVPVAAPRYEIRTAPPIEDWERDSAPLAAAMRRVPMPGDDDVLAFAEGVLPVHTPRNPDTLYLARDGQFEYVVERDENPAWFAFLLAVDGTRTLADLLGGKAGDAELVAVLRDALDADVVRTVPVPESAR